ncbi:MAG: TolC family protein [Thermoguttaceae bacterium]
MLHANLSAKGIVLAAALLLAGIRAQALGQPSNSPITPLPTTDNPPPAALAARPPSILGPDTRPIDLDSALRLAGVRNPELMIARERVTEAAAQRQLAAAQLLPNINAGTNYDDHTGNLQQSTGAMLTVHRQALYVGAGAGAIGAGTVAIPGVVWNQQLSELIFNNLISQQVVAQNGFALEATRNNVLLQVALAYEELLRAEGIRAVAIKNRDDTREVARLTAAYAKTGQGRQADADRAATELARREFDVVQTESQVLTASAGLCRLLSLDPARRLHPIDLAAVPSTVVADEISMKELIATALMRRPELKAQQAVIRQALLALRGARALPFTPNVLIGYSSGTFGGGSDLSPPELGNFQGRSDFDAVAFWTLQNLGVGNAALIRQAQSHLRTENYEMTRVLDQVRDEVAEAYARAHARWSQIGTSEKAVRSAQAGFREDVNRIRGGEGLPIEVLDSVRLLGEGRDDYVNAILDYNRAELELYVALGQPPANVLARPARGPAETVQPPVPEPPLGPIEK